MRRTIVDESYFERKARDLVAPEDEIEAWELEAQDIEGLGDSDERYGGAAFD
jgi:hypothetical protein